MPVRCRRLGDGLQGQELLRKEVLTASAIVGVADRVNVGVSIYGGHDNEDPTGLLLTGKVRLWEPLGPRTSTALYAGMAIIDRTEGNAQNESLTALDLAVPTELLLAGDASDRLHFSVYAGPRLGHESYTDDLNSTESFDGWLPGVLGGLHLQVGGFHVFDEGIIAFHVFGEGTMAWRPETTHLDASYDGGPIFLPTAGIVGHLGLPFGWDR